MSKTVMVIVILLVAGVCGFSLVLHDTEQESEITITKAWVKQTDDSAKYLVATTDGDVYSIEDSFCYFAWDASDRYAAIDIGKTYQVTTIGWRFQPRSIYRNIIELEEI